MSTGAPAAAGAYDWEPFFQRFGDMLPQNAMTCTMAAFGQLMNDFHGYNQSSSPPSRAEMAQCFRSQAQDFALGMVEPLFGIKRSSKLHELNCHAAEEIELRGDFTMADTSAKEQKHKEEKAAYRRTNRHTASAGRQLLTVAQARIILQDEEVQLIKEQPASAGTPVFGPAEAADPLSQSSEDGECTSSDEDVLSEAGFQPGPKLHTSGMKVPVEALSQRPCLVGLAGLLELPSYAVVSVVTAIHFNAKYEWGALDSTELVRSSDAYYGEAWHDCDLYRRHPSGAALFGRVRLIVVGCLTNCDQPVAVLQCMVKVAPLPDAPLASAGYQRLRWSFDSDPDVWPTLALVM